MAEPRQDAAERQPLYRQRACDQRGRSAPIDGVLQVSAPSDWIVLIGLAAVVLAVMAWSIFGRLEQGMSGTCALQAAGVKHAATAETTGVVTEVLARPGELVNVGDPLVRLAAPELSLAVELAQARSAALAAHRPASGEAAIVAAEAAALAASEATATLVLSPVSGFVGASVSVVGTPVSPGAAVAEVLAPTSGPPTAIIALSGEDAARVRPAMEVRITVTAAGESNTVRADARVSDDTTVASTDSPSDAEVAVAAHFTASSAALEALALRDGATCAARIVTDSRRPVELLVGRR